jgi:hypothetical protein
VLTPALEVVFSRWLDGGVVLRSEDVRPVVVVRSVLSVVLVRSEVRSVVWSVVWSVVRVRRELVRSVVRSVVWSVVRVRRELVRSVVRVRREVVRSVVVRREVVLVVAHTSLHLRTTTCEHLFTQRSTFLRAHTCLQALRGRERHVTLQRRL